MLSLWHGERETRQQQRSREQINPDEILAIDPFADCPVPTDTLIDRLLAAESIGDVIAQTVITAELNSRGFPIVSD